jgi:hypothetical protein
MVMKIDDDIDSVEVMDNLEYSKYARYEKKTYGSWMLGRISVGFSYSYFEVIGHY